MDRPMARLAASGLVVAVTFGGGALIGSVVGPDQGAKPIVEHDQHGGTTDGGAVTTNGVGHDDR